MARLRPNFMSGKLTDASISSSIGVLNSPGFAALPIIAGGDICAIQLDPLSLYGLPEIVTITSHDLNSETVLVERGTDGPTVYASGVAGGPRAHNQSGVQEDWYCSYTTEDFDHSTLYNLGVDTHPQYYGPIGDPSDRHQVVGAHSAHAILNDIYTVGFSVLWPGASDALAPGWLWCNGQPVSIASYEALYAALGNGSIWGENTTNGTFFLPPGGAIMYSAGGIFATPVGYRNFELFSHAHPILLTSDTDNAFASGHTHAFASGVYTPIEDANHSHTGVTRGTGTSDGEGTDHKHNLAGLTTDGTTATGSHAHTMSGNTSSGGQALLSAFWNLIIYAGLPVP